MSISSISGNGAFYSRPIKGRGPVSSTEKNTFAGKRTKGVDNDNQEQGQPAKPGIAQGGQPANQQLSEDAFKSFAQKYNVEANNKATNAYLNIGNYERQVALKQVFGIDIFV